MSEHDCYEDQRDRKSDRRPSAPDYLGYTVKDKGDGKEPFWVRIGAAWKHDDGKGLTLQMDAAPLDGKVTLREKRREEYERSRERPDHSPDRGPSRGR